MQPILEKLFRASRLTNAWALESLRDHTGVEIRQVHTALFAHIPFEGVRISTLSQRLGVTKQAVSQWVGELETMGAVYRVPDPTDGRAQLICLNRQGVGEGLAHLERVASQLLDGVEQQDIVAFERVLDTLISRASAPQ